MDQPAWQQSNTAYLFGLVEWVKDCLKSLIESVGELKPTKPSIDPPMAAEVESNLAPSLVYLCRRFGLSQFESRILLFCVAMELDPELPSLCGRAQENPSAPWPTFALCMRLFEGAEWSALIPESPLRARRLIEIRQERGMPVLNSPLRADERIVNFALGLNHMDERLNPLISPLPLSFQLEELPDSQSREASRVIQMLEAAAADSRGFPLIQFVGGDSPCKRQVAAAVAGEIGRPIFLIPAELIPSDVSELNELKQLWQRENDLLQSVLFVDASQTDASAMQPGSPLFRFCCTLDALTIVDLAEAQSGFRTRYEVFDIARPSPSEQREAWFHQLGPASAEFSMLLSGQFDLDIGSITDITGKAEFSSGNPGEESKEQAIWQLCRQQSRPTLNRLAQRIDARATFDQLALPKEKVNQLQDILAQVRYRATVYQNWGFGDRMNRGLGISVLFAGPSGTGKTMTASAIANSLNLDLYRIDLSQVVNKYIGETEKNLKRLFDAAEGSGAILLFDEADALFGKRTEVKDSHDRHANIETNYLLQRMESFRGLAILATNLKQSLDAAFLRRLRMVIDFPLPDAGLRRELWRQAFPAETPTRGLDYDYLARLHLTGGNIHAIALNAAFRSARSSGDVTMPDVLKTAQAEYQKLQKPAPSSTFQYPGRPGVPV